MPSDFSEKKLSSRTVYQGALLRVHEDEVELPDGGRARREYIVHPGAVVILPFIDANTLLLEHQFRYPLRRHFLELPAGKIEADEPAEQTALCLSFTTAVDSEQLAAHVHVSPAPAGGPVRFHQTQCAIAPEDDAPRVDIPTWKFIWRVIRFQPVRYFFNGMAMVLLMRGCARSGGLAAA